jgi:hypothetical protein
VAASRGFGNNALFELDRLGISAKAALDARVGQMLYEPQMYLENMIATGARGQRVYIADVVLGGPFELPQYLAVGARVWTTAAFAGTVRAVGVVEPQVRGRFLPFEVVLGGIIPFAGELVHTQFGGMRITVSARL